MGFADVRPICSRCGLPVDHPFVAGQDHAYPDKCISLLRAEVAKAKTALAIAQAVEEDLHCGDAEIVNAAQEIMDRADELLAKQEEGKR